MGKAQGALEYLMILSAVLITVGGVISVLYLSSSSLSSTVNRQVENALENEVLSRLAGSPPWGAGINAPLPSTLTTGFLVRLPALSTR